MVVGRWSLVVSRWSWSSVVSRPLVALVRRFGGSPCNRDSGDFLQVAPQGDHCEAGRPGDQLRDRVGLTESEFEQQQAAGSKTRFRLRQESSNHVEAVVAGEERGCGLVVDHLRLQRRSIAFGDVGRVGNDQIERTIESVEQIGAAEPDAVGHPVPRGVAARDLERQLRRIGGDDRDGGSLVRDRHRHAAAAGADVGDVRRRVARNLGERQFDEQLRLRTGDQHRGRHLEPESPEFFVPDDVRERFVRHAAIDERL